MATPVSLRRTFCVFCVFVVGLVLGGCTCDKPRAVAPSTAAICESQGETLSTAAPMTNSTIVPGTLQASFSVDESGQPMVHVPIDVAAGRGALALALRYDGTNVDGGLGVGFSLAGVEAVTLCPKSVAMDGEARAVKFDSDDALCAFGKRLVVVKKDEAHTTTLSTPAQPSTEWRIAKNTGGAFAAEDVALLQDWSFQQDSASSIDSTQM